MYQTYRFFKSIFALLLLLGMFIGNFVTVSPVSAATIAVTTTDDEDGVNMTDCSLREAIKAANSNGSYGGCDAGSGADTIILPAETYTLTSTLPAINTEIAIIGEDADTTIIQASTCNPITLPGGCDPAAYRIFVIPSPGILTLESIKIQHGNGSDYGGAISNNGYLSLLNCTLTANKSDIGSGGAIHNSNSGTANIIDSTLIDNETSAGDGGGIYNYGSLRLYGSTITENTAAYSGGGIYSATSGLLLIEYSTISSNTSVGWYGGGILNQNDLTIINSTISGNSAYKRGGGISSDGSLFMINSTVSGNSSTNDQGGGISNTDSLTISSSTISGNIANSDGGGFYNAGELSLTNSTVSGNDSQGDGGGIFSYSNGSMSLLNCTISDNSATGSGGGILNSGELSFSNTIIANSTGEDCYSYPDASIIVNTNNLIEIDAAAPYNCGRTWKDDPDLDPLADYGGPTHTHRLQSTSPAIDKVDTITCPITDQRGVGRTRGLCDIGSFELDKKNASPIFMSEPEDKAIAGVTYTYEIEVVDPDLDTITILAKTKPDWLSFTDQGDGTATLTGTPVVGTFDVLLKARDVLGANAEDQSFTITVRRPIPASADFSATPISGQAPLEVNFTNQSTGDYDNCSWDFGDGGTSTTCGNPHHTYYAAGEYTVSLTVDGVGGLDEETKTSYIDVSPASVPVSADFSGIPTSGQAPLEVSFTNQSIGDYDSCSWDFGDESPTSSDCNPLHTYQEPGQYTVSLTVSGDGGTDEAEKIDYIDVSAEPVPLVADFSATPTSGQTPLEVTFTNLTTGVYTSCTWDFGDGNGSTLCSNFKHMYLEAGTYTVSLTVDDGSGGTDDEIKTDYITVLDGEVSIFLPLILR